MLSPTMRTVMAAILTLPVGAEGQTSSDSRSPRFEFGAFFGGFNDESEFAPGDGSVQLDRGTLFGGHLGWILPSNLFLQADFAWSSDLRWVGEAFYTQGDATALRDMSNLTATLSLGYQLAITKRIEVFGSAGGGLVRWDVDGIGAEPQASAVVGTGARIFLSSALAVRAGTRWRYTGDAMQGLRAVSGAATEEWALWAIEPMVGLSVVTGRGGGDRDGDGVTDRSDDCPATATGAYVDQFGCPQDTDGDRIPDGLDACPDTPRGSRVTTSGCPLDTDEDSVLDGIDRCPATPQDTEVDQWGCTADKDRDGVGDQVDRCPSSAVGTEVDRHGCPVDTDGDGVSDGSDACPNTAADSRVDEAGCPISQVQEDLEETGRIVFSDVLFDLDMATPRASSRALLDLAAEALLRNPHLEVEIQGHTDSSGPDEYNRNLSERRAQAVLWYLRENFPDLDTSRLTARGYGEARPLASNETEEGRQRNRRVEFVVRGGGFD